MNNSKDNNPFYNANVGKNTEANSYNNHSQKIVVDIGGSGVRLGRILDNSIVDIHRVNVGSIEELASAIMQAAGRNVDAVAISTAGFVNTKEGYIRLSRVAPWIEGYAEKYLKEKLHALKVVIVNDGEAHALAMLRDIRIKYGAICLGIGTAVSFGVIDEQRNVLRTLSGENWDLGDLWLKSRAKDPYVWKALGSRGLQELIESMGESGYEHFGYRLGFFLSQLTHIFHPLTIALTGGIVQNYWEKMVLAVNKELSINIPDFLRTPKIVVLKEKESGLTGLIHLLNG
jgi:predicted NBD/HSP70 family sugar kinase